MVIVRVCCGRLVALLRTGCMEGNRGFRAPMDMDTITIEDMRQ